MNTESTEEEEDESGEDETEESGESEEESSGSEESSEDDEEETEEEETEEESDVENRTVEEKMARSVIKNKSIRFNGDCTAPNSTVKKSAIKSAVKKSAVKKTPGMAKPTNKSVHLNRTSQFKANESLANRRKSILETEMTREQLVEKLEALMAENAQIKRDKTKAEADLRSELVAKWSKREEDTEEYYQGQIQEQRKQVEDCYLKVCLGPQIYS